MVRYVFSSKVFEFTKNNQIQLKVVVLVPFGDKYKQFHSLLFNLTTVTTKTVEIKMAVGE